MAGSSAQIFVKPRCACSERLWRKRRCSRSVSVSSVGFATSNSNSGSASTSAINRTERRRWQPVSPLRSGCVGLLLSLLPRQENLVTVHLLCHVCPGWSCRPGPPSCGRPGIAAGAAPRDPARVCEPLSIWTATRQAAIHWPAILRGIGTVPMTRNPSQNCSPSARKKESVRRFTSVSSSFGPPPDDACDPKTRLARRQMSRNSRCPS